MVNYSVVYDKGFAVTEDFQRLHFLLEHNSDIELDTFNSLWEAYCNGCTKYSEQCIRRDPYMQHIIPTLEDIIVMPYHVPDFEENIPEKRFFAAMTSDYIAIFDNVNLVMSFVRNFDIRVHIKEFDSYESAFRYLNEQFIRFILPRSAYLNGDFKYVINLPLNTEFSIQCLIDWFHQSYHPPFAWANFNSYQTNFLPLIQNALEPPTAYPQIR